MPFEDGAIIGAQRATEGGAAVGVIGYLTSINWLGLSGIAIAVIGLCVQYHFQRKRDRREEELHRAKMSALGDRGVR